MTEGNHETNEGRGRGGFLPTLREFFDPSSDLRSLTLKFRDTDLERVFQGAYYRDNLFYIRFAHWAGIGLWVTFWLVASFTLERASLAELVVRIGLGVAVTLVSLALSYTSWYPRHWQLSVAVAHVATAVVWSTLRVVLDDPRVDWGYAGLMGLMAFTFFFSRIQTRYAVVAAGLMIAYYDTVVPLFTEDTLHDVVLANFFLLGFTAVDTAAAYGLERASRLLFVREREVDRERRRADALLTNAIPPVIAERLMARRREGQRATLAEDHPIVSVLFADLVSFTERAGQIPADELVATLDDLFSRFDALARETGVEKIKTVGDAYLAVAGAPEPRDDHATAVAELALRMTDEVRALRWPTGEPMKLRIGVASGPATAGVIGTERVAYDLWGDTVNLASRLETNANPGEILVSERTASLVGDRFVLGEPQELDLKGKGRIRAMVLEGERRAS